MWTWQLLVQIRQMLLEVQVGLSALPASAALLKGRPFPTGCSNLTGRLLLHFVVSKHTGMF